jgi:hypothetical protein
MPPCNRPKIAEFLQDLKEQISKVGLAIFPRAKNLQAMAQLNLTRQQVAEMALGLVVEDYTKGPEQEHGNAQNDVWVFGPSLDGQIIYFKFLDSGWGTGRKIYCYSIHQADYSMSYPCK